MEFKQQPKKSKKSKVLLAVVGFIFIIILIGVASSPDKTSTPSRSTNTDTSSTGSVQEVVKEALSDNEKIQIVSSNETTNDYLRTVHVTVKNISDQLASSVSLKVIYYAKDKQTIVGTGNGAAMNIPAGQTRVIDCLAMEINGASSYKVEVEMVLFE